MQFYLRIECVHSTCKCQSMLTIILYRFIIEASNPFEPLADVTLRYVCNVYLYWMFIFLTVCFNIIFFGALLHVQYCWVLHFCRLYSKNGNGRNQLFMNRFSFFLFPIPPKFVWCVCKFTPSFTKRKHMHRCVKRNQLKVFCRHHTRM